MIIILIPKDNSDNFARECFKCDICGRWIMEGEEYIIVNNLKICNDCYIKKEATYDDGYLDYIDKEIHERINTNE
jgi:hypothetical protein